MNGILNPPQILHYVIGFNLATNRIATMRLMAAVGGAVQQGADQAFYAHEILKALTYLKVIGKTD